MVMGAPGAFLYTGTAVVSASDTLAVSNNTDSPPLPPQGFLGMAVARGRILDTATDCEGVCVCVFVTACSDQASPWGLATVTLSSICHWLTPWGWTAWASESDALRCSYSGNGYASEGYISGECGDSAGWGTGE